MRIGEVSKFLSIKPETIRYYEKEGILSPGRKEEGTFREYNIWDIMDLFECRKYRQMDFGIKDVKHLMKAENLEGISRLLSGKYEEVLGSANRKLAVAAEIKFLKDRIENAPLNIGNYWFKSDGERVGIVFTERVGKRYSGIDIRNPHIQKWITDNLFMKGYMLVSLEDIRNGRDRNQWFFSTSLENFQKLSLSVDGTFHIPGQLYLHTVLDIGEKGSLNLDMLKPVLDHVDSKGLEMEGDIIGELMLRCYEGQSYHRYVELMVPIKK